MGGVIAWQQINAENHGGSEFFLTLQYFTCPLPSPTCPEVSCVDSYPPWQVLTHVCFQLNSNVSFNPTSPGFVTTNAVFEFLIREITQLLLNEGHTSQSI